MRSAAFALLCALACSNAEPGTNPNMNMNMNMNTATCESIADVDVATVSFNIPICAECMQRECCVALQACNGDADCVACSMDAISTAPACVNDPNFGDPSSVYNAQVRACQSDKCGCFAPGSPCCGSGGSACTPSDCAASCDRFPNC